MTPHLTEDDLVRLATTLIDKAAKSEVIRLRSGAVELNIRLRFATEKPLAELSDSDTDILDALFELEARATAKEIWRRLRDTRRSISLKYVSNRLLTLRKSGHVVSSNGRGYSPGPSLRTHPRFSHRYDEIGH